MTNEINETTNTGNNPMCWVIMHNCAILGVYTRPDWVKQTGIKPDDIDKALSSAADLFGAYMFGDVYGCEIVRVEVDADGEVVGEDSVDSCWGFYGPDHEASGLAEYAREVLAGLESDVLNRKKEKNA
jgi:hypothetical protein